MNVERRRLPLRGGPFRLARYRACALSAVLMRGKGLDIEAIIVELQSNRAKEECKVKKAKET